MKFYSLLESFYERIQSKFTAFHSILRSQTRHLYYSKSIVDVLKMKVFGAKSKFWLTVLSEMFLSWRRVNFQSFRGSRIAMRVSHNGGHGWKAVEYFYTDTIIANRDYIGKTGPEKLKS